MRRDDRNEASAACPPHVPRMDRQIRGVSRKSGLGVCSDKADTFGKNVLIFRSRAVLDKNLTIGQHPKNVARRKAALREPATAWKG